MAGNYILKGRTYKTTRGMLDAIRRLHPGTEQSGVRNGVITCSTGRQRNGSYKVVAEYRVGPPKLGEDMTVQRIPTTLAELGPLNAQEMQGVLCDLYGCDFGDEL